MNVRIDLGYDGAPFRGFARQPDVRTVQGEIEAALSRLSNGHVATSGAGRTDAGVHALGQVMSARLPPDLDPVKVRDALNAMCGPAIAVWSCSAVDDDFDARSSARSRLYVYAILQGDVHDPFLAHTCLYRAHRLDVDSMNEAAGHLVGRRDFASFGRVDPPEASSERHLYELRCWRRGNIVRIRARADGFIRQMVRSLVGTLIQVGEGRRSPDEMLDIAAAGDRAAAGPVSPPHGLCLVSVEYDDGWSRPPDPLGTV